MMSATRQLLLGACLIAGRTGAFHVPVASSLSQHTRSTLAVAGKCNSASVRRRFRSAGLVMAAARGEMQETIEARLSEALSPVHLEVINESHMHSGPAKESHFKVKMSAHVRKVYLLQVEPRRDEAFRVFSKYIL